MKKMGWKDRRMLQRSRGKDKEEKREWRKSRKSILTHCYAHKAC